jgi:hypothetical protein
MPILDNSRRLKLNNNGILNRQIIGSVLGFVYNDQHYNVLYLAINEMKWRLFDAGVKKGDLITISIMEVNIQHVASIFACAEMGLRVFILDSPATKESLPFTKLALHGPSDYYIYSSNEDTTKIYNGLHDEMMRRYGGIGIDCESPASSNQYFEAAPVVNTDPFLISSTSGTTGASKPITFSHQEVMSMSIRNIEIFWFGQDAKVIHSRNLHHASAMLTHLLPALMNAYSHSSFAIGHDRSADEDLNRLSGLKDLIKTPPSNIMIPNKEELYDFLETFVGPFKRTVNINMCGFVLDEEFVELAKEYNVLFQSHYGSIDTAIPLLINRIGEDSTIVPNSLGVLPDDFYKTTLENGRMKVEHEWWDEPRYMDDELELIDGQYIIHPKPRHNVELPEGFDITPFFQDTKINYEQLRGHIHEVKK